MAWVKALHISALVVWCATLVYMPLLHARQRHMRTRAQFLRLRMMSRYLFVVIASPAAIAAIVSGGTLVYLQEVQSGWLVFKLGVVSLMALFHARCGHVLVLLGHESGRVRHKAGAWTVLIPVTLIAAVLWLVLVRPATWLDRPVATVFMLRNPALVRCSLFPHDARTPVSLPASPPRPPARPSIATTLIPMARSCPGAMACA